MVRQYTPSLSPYAPSRVYITSPSLSVPCDADTESNWHMIIRPALFNGEHHLTATALARPHGFALACIHHVAQLPPAHNTQAPRLCTIKEPLPCPVKSSSICTVATQRPCIVESQRPRFNGWYPTNMLLWCTPSKLTAMRCQITPTGIDNAHALVVSLQRHVPRLGGRPPVFISIVGRRINTPRVRQHGCLARWHQGNRNRACGNIIVTSCASRRCASC
jgi:hypothetical protein